MDWMKKSTGISVDVPLSSCRFATGHPTPQMIQQDGTHLSTFDFGRKQVKRLEDSMTFSFYRKFTPYRNKCVRGMINLPFCLLFFFFFVFFLPIYSEPHGRRT